MTASVSPTAAEAAQATAPAPTRENSCAVAVTYHPDAGLAGRLLGVATQVGRLIVVDNGSGDNPALAAATELDGDLRLLRYPDNRGLATAFNAGIDQAMRDGFHWVLLLDQDSAAGGKLMETLIATWHAVPDRERLAVIGANYIQGGSAGPFAPEREVAGWRERATVISSGSLIALAACRRIGAMQDDLFIDYVDHEFCLRARAAGYRVVLTGPAVMQHAIGEERRRHVGGTSVGSSGHSAVRRYYRARNQLRVFRKYLLREPRWALHDLATGLRALVQMTLVERERPTKWKAVWTGVVHGLLGRGGPR